MGQDTKIEWADHTFNPWRGCVKVSLGCKNCYAETMAKRNPKILGEWGPHGVRVVAADSYWRLPFQWDKSAALAGERRRVFCASLGDVFETRPDLIEPRARLFKTIGATANLDWLLLTKRPEVARQQWEFYAGLWAANQVPEVVQRTARDFVIPNVWLGASVEHQRAADLRIPNLMKTGARVRFLSVEPLLGPVNLRLGKRDDGCEWERHNLLDWVIVGGESGPKARACNLEWVRSIVDQCRVAGVPVFVKQLGRHPIEGNGRTELSVLDGRAAFYPISDKKGGDIGEFPEDLQIRQFPEIKEFVHG